MQGTYPTVCGTRPGQLGCQHHHRGIECIDIRHVWYRGEQCRDIPYCVCGIGVNNAGTYPTVCVWYGGEQCWDIPYCVCVV